MFNKYSLAFVYGEVADGSGNLGVEMLSEEKFGTTCTISISSFLEGKIMPLSPSTFNYVPPMPDFS